MTVQKFQAMQIGNQEDSELSNQNQVSQFTSLNLVKVMMEEGYDVQELVNGDIAIKGNEFDHWTTWREIRESFQEI
jgi:hypothetical protein